MTEVVKHLYTSVHDSQIVQTQTMSVINEMPTEAFHMVLAIRHPAMGEEGGEADLSRVTSCASLKMHKNHVISMFTSEDSVTCFPLRGEQGPYVLAADISPNRVFLLATV